MRAAGGQLQDYVSGETPSKQQAGSSSSLPKMNQQFAVWTIVHPAEVKCKQQIFASSAVQRLTQHTAVPVQKYGQSLPLDIDADADCANSFPAEHRLIQTLKEV